MRHWEVVGYGKLRAERRGIRRCREMRGREICYEQSDCTISPMASGINDLVLIDDHAVRWTKVC